MESSYEEQPKILEDAEDSGREKVEEDDSKELEMSQKPFEEQCRHPQSLFSECAGQEEETGGVM